MTSLFLDDDIVPCADLVAAHVEAHPNGNGLVAGRVLQPWDDDVPSAVGGEVHIDGRREIQGPWAEILAAAGEARTWQLRREFRAATTLNELIAWLEAARSTLPRCRHPLRRHRAALEPMASV
jgi:hypothetical protein